MSMTETKTAAAVKAVTPEQRAQAFENISEQLQALQQQASANQINLFVEMTALTRDAEDDPTTLSRARVSLTTVDSSQPMLDAMTAAATEWQELDEDEDAAAEVAGDVEHFQMGANARLQALSTVARLTEYGVPSEIVTELLHLPLVGLGKALKMGYMVRAAAMKDMSVIEAAADGDEVANTVLRGIATGTGPAAAALAMIQRNGEEDTPEALMRHMAIGLLTTIHHMADTIQRRVEKIDPDFKRLHDRGADTDAATMEA